MLLTVCRSRGVLIKPEYSAVGHAYAYVRECRPNRTGKATDADVLLSPPSLSLPDWLPLLNYSNKMYTTRAIMHSLRGAGAANL